MLWKREWQPTSVFLPGGFHERGATWQATVHGVAKSWTRLSKDSGIGQGDQLSVYGKILHEDEGCIKMIWRIGEKLLNMF